MKILVALGSREGADLLPPKGAQKAAELGLRLRKQYGRGGTAIGVARARDLKNGRQLSEKTVRRMKAYFDRHRVDKKASGWKKGEDKYPSAGYIAWLLWGGDPGYSWAKRKVSSMS